MDSLSFVWLEITGKCQLQCVHCYAESGPQGDHGAMSSADWRRVIDQAAALGAQMVQFIGGEPTLHPDLQQLVDHALSARLEVEVFTNLVHVSEQLWETFSRPKVSLATSYYSDNPAQHAAITRRPTYARTKANIAEALRRRIPLRAGVIDLGDGQRATAGQAELVELGVPQVGYDRLRQVGRGVRDEQASPTQLCGRCGDGVVAVSPEGLVWPCVFSRWLPVGNVLDRELAEILDGPEAVRVRDELRTEFAKRKKKSDEDKCAPKCAPSGSPCYPDCNPACQPNCSPNCSPSCRPCGPGRRCWPDYK